MSKSRRTTNHKKIVWIIVIILVISFVYLWVFSTTQNYQRQQDELQDRLQQIENQKQYCDDLRLEIRDAGSGPGYGWSGITFCVYSNNNADASLKIKLKDGNLYENIISIGSNSCVLQQISSGNIGSTYYPSLSYDDISYIEVTSNTCPNINDLLIDMNKIKPNTDEGQDTGGEVGIIDIVSIDDRKDWIIVSNLGTVSINSNSVGIYVDSSLMSCDWFPTTISKNNGMATCQTIGFTCTGYTEVIVTGPSGSSVRRVC